MSYDNLCPSGEDLDRITDKLKEKSAEVLRGLTFTEFSLINKESCESTQGFNHKLSSWSLSDWFLALTGEIGEAANIGKKLNRVRDGIPGNKEIPEELKSALRRELANAFIYLDLLCQSQGFRIGDIIMEVFDAKSEQIGYER